MIRVVMIGYVVLQAARKVKWMKEHIHACINGRGFL